MEMSYLEFLGSLVDQKCEVSAYQNGLKYSSIRIKGPAPMVYSTVIEILKTAAIRDKKDLTTPTFPPLNSSSEPRAS